jgi:signal transduction histidine kinase
MTADIDNLRLAWRHWVAERDRVQLNKLVDSLWLLYDARGWLQDTIGLTNDLLDVLSSAPSTPERATEEITLRMSLARALMATKGYSREVEEAYATALQPFQGRELPQLFPVLRSLASYYIAQSEFDKGARIGREILHLAERQNDDGMLIEGHLVLGVSVITREGIIAMSAAQPLTYMVFPAFIWAALRLGPQGATLAVAVGAVIAVLSTSYEVGPFVELSPTDSALNLQLYIVFAALTTCCLAAIVSERRRGALELAESQRREGERAALERQRIARDLHDSVSQSLFSTTLHVRTAQRALEVEQHDAGGPVGEELHEIGQLTRGALAEMRALILELQPGALAEEGLVAALAKLAAALSAREGLVIEVDGPDGHLPLGPEVEEQLYRLGQEALANVVKHARASSATVRIAAAGGTVAVEVSDDGRGFDPATVGPEHFGLRSMRGRVADLGGRLDVTSAPGGGTVLRVEVPARSSQ